MPKLDDDLLAKFANGDEFDWKRSVITGDKLSEIVRDNYNRSDRPISLAISNGIIDGNIYLDGVGTVGSPMALKLIDCEIRGGFRAWASTWHQLAICKSSINWIDIPRSKFTGDLLLADLKCNAWLEMRGADIAGALDLNGSSFQNNDRECAVELSETRIGLSLRAIRLCAAGPVYGQRLQVGGTLYLDGAHIAVPPNIYTAVDLSRARIGGEIRLCSIPDRRFETSGAIILLSAEIGALTLRGSKLVGRNDVSFVGDNILVRETIDIGGLSNEGYLPFSSTGGMRFIAAQIGGQLQLYDAILEASNVPALDFSSSRICRDVIFGKQDTKLKVSGQIAANSTTIDGRVIMSRTAVEAKALSFSMNEARISGEVALYESVLKGAVSLDKLWASGISIEDLLIERTSPEPNLDNLPQAYAHPEDALLDFNFAQLVKDVHIDRLVVRGGNVRFIGAKVLGGMQLSRLDVRSPRLALIGQSAQITNGLQISGAKDTPAIIDGDLSFMGMKIDGDITFVDMHLGNPEKPISLNFCNSRIDGRLNFTRLILQGELNAAGCRFNQDFILNGVCINSPNRTAIDLRSSHITGVLHLASVGVSSSRVPAKLNGHMFADGADVGALEWHELHLSDGSRLELTNMRIGSKLHADLMIPDGGGLIDLTGSSVPELCDSLDDRRDGWGAGSLTLALDGFRYDRLSCPSGRISGTQHEIRQWRSAWLQRRIDTKSARSGRLLSRVLRDQGLFEASRLVLMDAFAAEGRASPSIIGRLVSKVWGAAFGFGLSGHRALLTIIVVWLLGVCGASYLQRNDLLVFPPQDLPKAKSCGASIDPFIFAADTMLPVLDLGEDKLCQIGPGPTAKPDAVKVSFIIKNTTYNFVPWRIYRLLEAIYAVVGWIVVSLAIATLSGVFKRSGRE